MKGSDKTQIYGLLNVISDYCYGYKSPEFNQNFNFQDDMASQSADENKDSSVEKKFVTCDSSRTTINTTKPKSSSLTLDSIERKIHECKRCPLHSGKTNYVPGTGVSSPYVLVIGEGPGEEEDKSGLPFVGPAGKLLDKMLNAIDLDRNVNCYIANAVKCRPPMNRDPLPEESLACRSFLDAQIHVLKPKMILLVGKVSAHDILQNDYPIAQMRQRLFEYNGIPVVVTYHPSALLRNQELKRPAWEDLKFFKSKLEEIAPDYNRNFKK